MIVALALAAAAALAYLPSLQNGFLNWDDDAYVVNNSNVAGLSWANGKWAFTEFHSGNWHPLTWLSHAVDRQVYGLSHALGHHLTNILLHALNTALLFIVLRRLTGRLWPSAVVAALFALHPLHVEAVAWIAERKELLCAAFSFLALWAYAAYVARPSLWRYAAIVLAFAAALMSKPMAVTLPLVMLLLDWWPLRRLSWRTVGEKAPLLALAAASCVITVYAQASGGAFVAGQGLALDQRLANAAVSYARYLFKMFWPAPGSLVPFYALPQHGGLRPTPWLVGGALALLAAVTVAALLLRGRRPYLLLGWFWFLGTLVPVIGLVQVGLQAMADRYTYVPLVGAALAAVWLIDDCAAARGGLRRAALVAGAAGAVALAALTWQQQGIYRDSVALWEYTIRTNDGSYLAHAQLGQAYNVAKRTREANEHLRRATELNPDCGQAQFNLAYNLMQAGEYDEAMRRFGEALRIGFQPVLATFDIGLCLARQGRTDEAMAKFREALAIDPAYKEARLRLAELLLEADRLDDAAAEFRLVLQSDPKSVLARLNLGAALLKQGRLDEAVVELRRVVEQAPQMYQAYHNLGLALEKQGRTAEAERHFAEAERLKRLGSSGR